VISPQAGRENATDLDIRDTVLIAAAFWMYHCYVVLLQTLLLLFLLTAASGHVLRGPLFLGLATSITLVLITIVRLRPRK
jgi:hypothetical protein